MWVGDLDGDGLSEVLFARRHATTIGEDALICFDNSGHERWRFRPGRTVRVVGGAYPSLFGVQAFAVAVVNGKPLIVLSSFHHPYAPAQIALLDVKGHLIGEYWHFGHLSEVLFADVEGKGHPLIYLGGINNQLKHATLVVLDPTSLLGLRQASNGPFLDMPKAVEHTLQLFERSLMNQRLESYNGVRFIERMPNGLLIHVLERFGSTPGHATVMYHLDSNLGLQQVGASDQFMNDVARLNQEGMLPTTADADLQRLAKAYHEAIKILHPVLSSLFD